MIDGDDLRAELDATEPVAMRKVTLVEYVGRPMVAAEIWRARGRGLAWEQITVIVNRRLGASYAPTTVATTMSRYAPRRNIAEPRIGTPPRRPIVARSPLDEKRGSERRSDKTQAPGDTRDAGVPEATPSDRKSFSAVASPGEPDLQRESVSSASSSRTPFGVRPVRRPT